MRSTTPVQPEKGTHLGQEIVPAAVTERVEVAVPDGTSTTGSVVSLAAVTPTQVRKPWQATLRTFFQALIPTVIALGFVVPEIVQIVLDEAGEAMPDNLRVLLLATSAAVAGVAAALARIMAIPKVELFLRHVGLSAAGKQ